MLQCIEFEVYVNKHICLFGKKKRKIKCGYHAMTKLYVLYYQLLRKYFRKLTFVKNNYVTSYLNICNIYI